MKLTNLTPDNANEVATVIDRAIENHGQQIETLKKLKITLLTEVYIKEHGKERLDNAWVEMDMAQRTSAVGLRRKRMLLVAENFGLHYDLACHFVDKITDK